MNHLERNLAALPASLALAVRSAAPRRDERRSVARDGRPINGVERDGRLFTFHSAYDPAREAFRAAEATPLTDLIVCLGLGYGYLVEPLLERCERLIVIEPDPALLRSGLAAVDLVPPIVDGRLVVATDDDRTRLASLLGGVYIAPFHRGIRVVELAGRVRSEPERFAALREELDHAIEALRDDIAIQARFGRLWHRNTVINLRRIARDAAGTRASRLPEWDGSPVIVAAAGPSLADVVEEIRRSRGTPILAVDTAAPILAGHGIAPDLVLTIDAQLASYHHALCSPSFPAALDLAASPSVAAAFPSPAFMLTDHPLHALGAALGLVLPRIDVRGGNVTHAALDLAVTLGAARITLYGADFSYPDGESYPRGSYIHRFFATRATRTATLSTRHFAFLADRVGVHRDPTTPSLLRHPLLDRYARSYAAHASSLPVPVHRVAGRGLVVEAEATASVSGRRSYEVHTRADAGGTPAYEVLTRLTEAFEPLESRTALMRALGSDVTVAVMAARAIIPLAAALRAASPDASDDEIIRAARRYHRSLVA